MKAHELFIQPGIHCKGNWALTADNLPISALDPQAIKFCLLGALYHTYGSPHAFERLHVSLGRMVVTEEFQIKIQEVFFVSGLSLASYPNCSGMIEVLAKWNDEGKRTQEDVRQLLIKADV